MANLVSSVVLALVAVQLALASANCDTERTEACTLSDVEAEEAMEGAGARVELLQSKLKLQPGAAEVTKKEAVPTAHVTEERGTTDTDALVSKDHNDNICMLCGKPLPERLVEGKVYKEFRTDCGNLSSPVGPSAASLAAPVAKLAQVSENGVESNAFCQLNFAKACVDAVANKDYLYWAKSLDLNSTASRANAAWDGRYCRLNGFLDASMVALQHDFEATQAKARDLCETKYAKYNIENLTFMDMTKASRYDDSNAPSLAEAELLAAWNCAMGDLGCDLSLCAYSFCAKDSGTGLYDECQGWHPVDGMPTSARIS